MEARIRQLLSGSKTVGELQQKRLATKWNLLGGGQRSFSPRCQQNSVLSIFFVRRFHRTRQKGGGDGALWGGGGEVGRASIQHGVHQLRVHLETPALNGFCESGGGEF